MSDLSDPVADALGRLAEGEHHNAWAEAPALRQRSERRARHRRRALTGSAAGLGVIALVVVLTVSLLPGSGPTPTSPGRYSASVHQVPIGGGAVHLVVDIGKPASHSKAGAVAVAGDEADFATTLTRELASQAGSGRNVLASPLSADVALSMLELGARGATQTAIARALRSNGLSSIAVGQGWGALLGELQNGLGPARLNIADSAWLQRGVPFVSSYLSGLATDYGDAAYQADFAGNLDGAVDAINQWVDQTTAGRIKQLFPPGSLDPSTILVLANALHFRAPWNVDLGAFEPAPDEVFNAAEGGHVTVPAMTTVARAPVAVNSSYTALDLPYAGGRFSALVVEPKGPMATFLAGMSIARILSSMRSEQVTMTIPTLSLSDNTSMNATLSALGMGVAFSPAADLSGISPAAAQVSDVQQANRLVLSEWGTDFASATGISVISSGLMAARLVVTIDRPYMLFLRDRETGVVVASAVVNNPLAQSY